MRRFRVRLIEIFSPRPCCRGPCSVLVDACPNIPIPDNDGNGRIERSDHGSLLRGILRSVGYFGVVGLGNPQSLGLRRILPASELPTGSMCTRIRAKLFFLFLPKIFGAALVGLRHGTLFIRATIR
jgi:hypothetical protein